MGVAERVPPLMLSAYDIAHSRLTGSPILLETLQPLGPSFLAFGSIWLLRADGLETIDSSALACQVAERCASKLETRYQGALPAHRLRNE
jgi:hypothetical protein